MMDRRERLVRMTAKLTAQGKLSTPVRVTPIAETLNKLAGKATEALAQGAGAIRDLKAVQHRAEVERLSRAGFPAKEIARELGLSPGHVTKIRKDLGLTDRKRRTR